MGTNRPAKPSPFRPDGQPSRWAEAQLQGLGQGLESSDISKSLTMEGLNNDYFEQGSSKHLHCHHCSLCHDHYMWGSWYYPCYVHIFGYSIRVKSGSIRVLSHMEVLKTNTTSNIF